MAVSQVLLVWRPASSAMRFSANRRFERAPSRRSVSVRCSGQLLDAVLEGGFLGGQGLAGLGWDHLSKSLIFPISSPICRRTDRQAAGD